MAERITPTQYVFLRLLANYQVWPQTGKPIVWCPRDRTVPVGGSTFTIGGAGQAGSLRALDRRGLIEFAPRLGKYACRITKAGLRALLDSEPDREAVLALRDLHSKKHDYQFDFDDWKAYGQAVLDGWGQPR